MTDARFATLAALALLLLASPELRAQETSKLETLKVAAGQRGSWSAGVAELGQLAGIFKKRGLALEILYTQGTGETQQALISGSVDIAVDLGATALIGAYAKGAPLRAIGSGATGLSDVFWYVPASSNIRSMQEAADKTIGHSTNGSSTNIALLGLLDHYRVKAKPTATGPAPATFTAVMSGQIDIGYSAAPFGLAELEQGKIRIIARGNEVPGSDRKTVRLLVTNIATLQNRKDAVARFVQAYRDTVEWMYADPAAPKMFADMAGIALPIAVRVGTEFYSKTMLDPDRVLGMDANASDALAFKFITQALTQQQLVDLVQVPPPLPH